MRILYVAAGTPIPGTHGGSVHALQLCRALARAGHEVHVAALPPDPPESSADLETRVQLHPLRPALLSQLEWTRFWQVRGLAERLRPDVVIERFYTFGGAGLLAARALGRAAVLEINSPARPYPGSLRDRLDALTLVRPIDRWRRWQLRQARAYYATSEVLVPDRIRERTRVIVNGVDCARIRPGPPIPDRGALRGVYVSSFRSWHGAEHLAQAVARCIRSGVEIEVTCVGTGPRLPAARRIAQRCGAGNAMRFVGKVPHTRVAELLAAAHVGLAPFDPGRHSALQLGWFWSPIKIFEYLAAGLPVLTADIPELRRLLTDEVARFYPPGDAAGLAAALAGWSAHREQLRRASGAARALAEARYSWDQQAAIVSEVLAEAVGSRA